ncbi:MAG: alpha/beta hydrolase [Betaproteobacteria bacterium]|nr:alpha/beta hydrolase [Betaproteobacteria bacterium]
MTPSRFGDLEVLSASPAGSARPTPLLFIHGAYAGAWCWAEYFLPWFADAGYVCHAVSLSGHGASSGRDRLDRLGIEDYVADVARVVAALPQSPVLIGHSMGGMVVQKYLERAAVPAVVLMASVPPQGLWASALHLALHRPMLLGELNRVLGGGAVGAASLQEALLVRPADPERLHDWLRHMQPESHRAIWDMTLFNLPRVHRMHRPPMLVLGAEHDLLIRPGLVEHTAHAYGTEARIFPGMGHGMMLEADWDAVARHVRDWLVDRGV